ncbi:MAG: hypothetical protein R2844_19770 [Caldilineales bacterium]
MTDTTQRAPGESKYFAVQADIGITKHIGGRKATDELVALCGIERGDGVGGRLRHRQHQLRGRTLRLPGYEALICRPP